MTGPAVGAAAFKLPTDPYPGLRPFLAHEAALLLGRGRQIREVIARLRETQFVAVIGGSGSGKSSLIRAGVVPDLLGFGIPEAGDYWIPVVSTPGTEKSGSEAGASDAEATKPPNDAKLTESMRSKPSTPIIRLAWKFSKVLAPAAIVANLREQAEREEAEREAQPVSPAGEQSETGGSTTAPDPLRDEAEERQRRDEIAVMFRQGGFARLVKEFSAELPSLGPLRERAHFLFVIDQFEELFHPHNRNDPDAKALVEAVIDHFFNPHPRCFVVLTMRSEHLADCAAYLELPDAINKASYLVRRLDERELREAIVGPAKYFLRIERRGEKEPSALPDDVVFDEGVIKRLLADVSSIADDPDHLPLLQHALARTWESATRRNAAGVGQLRIAARVEWIDLEHAVDPASTRPPGWLSAEGSINTLRDSLENWAEAAYRTRSEEDQRLLDAVLRQLAYKDPNNGQYTQQRVEVDRALHVGDVEQSRASLHALLQKGFLDTVNYLFWDTENPDRVTLKVSHESFIRGWTHFRELVDEEANRFDEFVAMLRKCLMWGRDSDERTRRRHLLETSDFDRLEAAGLTPVLVPGIERDSWFDALAEYRDGDRLGRAHGQFDAYIQASRDRLKRLAEERERMYANRRRLIQGTAIAALVAAVVVPIALYSLSVQSPAMDRIAQYATARDLVQRNADKGQYRSMTEPGKSLDQLRLAAAAYDRSEQSSWAVALSEWMGEHVREAGFKVTGTKQLLALTTSEPEVNGTLRRMLTNNAWPVGTASSGSRPPARAAHDCLVIGPDGKTQKQSGQLFRRAGTDRAIFVASPSSKAADPTLLYEATMTSNGDCAARSLLPLPPVSNLSFLFDANTEHMAVAGATCGGLACVTLYAVTWGPGPDKKSLIASLRQRSTVTDPAVVDMVREELKTSEAGKAGDRAAAVATWPAPGGEGVAVNGNAWRLFSEAAQHIDGTDGIWEPLGTPGPVCDALERVLKSGVQPGFASEMHERGERCFEIQRGNPQDMGTSTDEEVLVAVYAKPLDVGTLKVGEAPPAAIASLSGFGRFPEQNAASWMVGEKGEFDGWIARKETDAHGGTSYFAAPWSTPALKRLAESVLPATNGPEPSNSRARAPSASPPSPR